MIKHGAFLFAPHRGKAAAFETLLQSFRIAEGEGEPESCAAHGADGYMVSVRRDKPGYSYRTFYYRKEADAVRALEEIRRDLTPSGGQKWWPSATRYIA